MINFKKNYLIFKLYLRTRFYCNKIIGLHDNRIKIGVSKPPIKNQANTSLVNLLAKEFGVIKKNIIIKKGKKSFYKIVQIKDPQRIPKIFLEKNKNYLL